jgi:hypothetical protein
LLAGARPSALASPLAVAGIHHAIAQDPAGAVWLGSASKRLIVPGGALALATALRFQAVAIETGARGPLDSFTHAAALVLP